MASDWILRTLLRDGALYYLCVLNCTSTSAQITAFSVMLASNIPLVTMIALAPVRYLGLYLAAMLIDMESRAFAILPRSKFFLVWVVDGRLTFLADGYSCE